MKISYRRTGGFSGMVMSFSADDSTLSPEKAATLKNLVAVSDFFALPSKIISVAPGADQFQYTVTVEADQRTHSVEVGDASIPENLRPLLNELTALSRRT